MRAGKGMQHRLLAVRRYREDRALVMRAALGGGAVEHPIHLRQIGRRISAVRAVAEGVQRRFTAVLIDPVGGAEGAGAAGLRRGIELPRHPIQGRAGVRAIDSTFEGVHHFECAGRGWNACGGCQKGGQA